MSGARISPRIVRRRGAGTSRRLLLLVGTPGSGKRPVGNYLAQEHRFVHLDFSDAETREQLLAAPDVELRAELLRRAEHVGGLVITWAAGPAAQLRQLRRLRGLGVEVVWCDGDRGAACRAHYADAPRPPLFRFVDTFTTDGRFRPLSAVAAELLAPRPASQPSVPQRAVAAVRVRAAAAAGALAGAAAVAGVALVAAGVGGGHAPARPAPALALRSAQVSPAGALPRQGVLVTGHSLAGIHLGDTMATVKRVWGGKFTRCGSCTPAMWFFFYPPPSDPVGAGVQFSDGRVVAVFTLGSPSGWRTATGIRVGQILPNPSTVATGRWLTCAGYSAQPTEVSKAAVTSILTQGAAVYGFALTRPSVSPCH